MVDAIWMGVMGVVVEIVVAVVVMVFGCLVWYWYWCWLVLVSGGVDGVGSLKRDSNRSSFHNVKKN